MLHKKWISIALLATAAVSTTVVSSSAFADNRGINTALGAVVGAVIGNSVGGQDAAIIGGVLGAVVGASASGRDDDRYYGRRQSQVYYQPQPVYYQPAPVQARPYYRDAYPGRNDYRDRYQGNVHRVDYDRYDRNQYRR